MTANDILIKMNEALNRFGTYSFDDKGAHEVMDISSIVSHVKSLNKEDAAKLLKEVVDAKGFSDRNKSVADAIMGDCDDMLDEWFEYVLENSGADY